MSDGGQPIGKRRAESSPRLDESHFTQLQEQAQAETGQAGQGGAWMSDYAPSTTMTFMANLT